MDTPREALDVLKHAEAALREIIEATLQQHRYRDVARVAEIADALAGLIGRLGSTPSQGDRRGRDRGTKSRNSAPLSSRRAQADQSGADPGRGKYPRFERDGEKLIKIGWSKKDRRVYEHRAPREAVYAFANRIAEKAAGRKPVSMDDLLPVKDERGMEIPTYQAYLALAWLRDAGAVERRGKDGYAFRNGALGRDELERLWPQTPSRT